MLEEVYAEGDRALIFTQFAEMGEIIRQHLRETFTDEESERLLRGYLDKALFDNGLYCRADDRGDPVIQLSPPLICGQAHFDEMEQILRTVLTEAGNRL